MVVVVVVVVVVVIVVVVVSGSSSGSSSRFFLKRYFLCTVFGALSGAGCSGREAEAPVPVRRSLRLHQRAV